MTPNAIAKGLAGLVAATLAAVSAAEAVPPPATDPRSVELLRQECRTSHHRREVTLFGNGTVRVREGTPGSEQMKLGEYSPEEVAAFLARLAELDLSETDRGGAAMQGDWIERCRVELPTDGGGVRRFDYGRFDSHSLALARALAVVEDVAAGAGVASDGPELPADYRPRSGDQLLRKDGELFEVVDLTADGHGVELVGLRQPVTIYMPISELRREFERLVRRRGAR